ncbi:hypothetical protein AB1Y20_008858 [Prymnesium parvum]|uniref:Peptidylamidoglycolate lyase n=1 Tax=Prymnesium parvum TaxID=97485 RepID=A0AB34ITJ9_PRYPA
MPADRRRWHTLCLLRLLPHMSVGWAAPAGWLKYAKQREIGLGYGKAPLQFNHPSAISTLPSTGDLVITDSWNHRLQVVSPRGTSRLACGKFGVGKGQFWQPASVVANEKSVFIADTQNHRIQKLRADNFSTLRSVGSFGDGRGQMNMPK